MSSNPGPSRKKPTKLLLFPREGDSEAMDTGSHVSASPAEIPAAVPYSGLLQSIPVVTGMCQYISIGNDDKIKLSHALPQEEVSEKKEQPTEIKLSDIKCFEKIGEGAGGIVQKAIHLPTKTKLAIKVYSSLVNRGFLYRGRKSRTKKL
eukprot:TRINITY_DN3419_c0_g1_i17.p2 TRINITY_DN3419_c0_g1~~TRINITY_DN3419_c0_g1_i17.p2  ORF type:complete len:149 (+),score=23.72 TRINITY_DN3419_c0_g1_i17:125-571(+)